MYDQNYKEGLKTREWYVHFAKAEGQARVDKFLIYFKQLTYNYMYWMLIHLELSLQSAER